MTIGYGQVSCHKLIKFKFIIRNWKSYFIMKNVLPFVTNIKPRNRIFLKEKNSILSNLLNLLQCCYCQLTQKIRLQRIMIQKFKTNFKIENKFLNEKNLVFTYLVVMNKQVNKTYWFNIWKYLFIVFTLKNALMTFSRLSSKLFILIIALVIDIYQLKLTLIMSHVYEEMNLLI